MQDRCLVHHERMFACPGTRLREGARRTTARYRHGRMSEDRSYIERNTRERERLRGLVERLDDDELRTPVNEHWTVAAVFGHIAFWDARMLALADKLERGVAFSPSDAEPEDVDWINDASRPLIHAIPPREAARLALSIAEETDARVATLPVERLWPRDPREPALRRAGIAPGRASRRGRGGARHPPVTTAWRRRDAPALTTRKGPRRRGRPAPRSPRRR